MFKVKKTTLTLEHNMITPQMSEKIGLLNQPIELKISSQSSNFSLEKLEKRLTNIAYQVALTQNSYFEVVSGVHWVTTSWMTTPWIWWDINQSEIKRHQEVAILHGPSQLTGCWLYDHLGTFYLLVVSCLERWQKGFNEDSQEMPPSRWWHNSDLV